MKRRNFLSMTGAIGTTGFFSIIDTFANNAAGISVSSTYHSHSNYQKILYPDGYDNTYKALFNKLRKHLIDCIDRSKVKYDNNLKIHSPCVSSGYRGLWPDDFLYPLLVEPGLYSKERLTQIIKFLTESMVNLTAFPDRVDSDGMPMMHPGFAFSQHLTELMPNHLPAAWIRLIDNFENMGATIPRKNDWAQLFKRGIDSISFACGLAYSDPQHPRVGFGFHDMVAITGFELMSSMILHFGILRAIRLFDRYIEKQEIEKWKQLAKGVPDNLYRLFDEEEGAYFAGSKDCRQVNVWGNGLAYWMSGPEIRKKIGQYFERNRNVIFLKGATRQIAEPGGWQRMFGSPYDPNLGRYDNSGSPVGGYINGGYWSVGTGWILPVLAIENPELAIVIAKELVENTINLEFPECISSDGQPGGASGFIAGIALPMMAFKAIIEKKDFSDYF